jgi:hypothetical protein
VKPVACLCLMLAGMVAAQAQNVDARASAGRQFAYFIAPFDPYTGPPSFGHADRDRYRGDYGAPSDRADAREHHRRPARRRDPGQRPYGS